MYDFCFREYGAQNVDVTSGGEGGTNPYIDVAGGIEWEVKA
jgi:hypothetical protein